MPRRRVQRKRYTQAEKKRILATSAKEGLTGKEVSQRFGVSTLSFYRWRGPVQGAKAKALKGSTKVAVDERALRAQVRARIARILPEIIQQEVAEAVAAMLGKRRPGRPRAA